MQAQSVCGRCEVSGVINFGLELVMTPSWIFQPETERCDAMALKFE